VSNLIEEKLELVLITYNRSEYLENTLSQLLESPFKDCKFTVLDNCSTDKTPQVCLKYQKMFKDFHIMRHKHNIGGNANILRGVETSNSLYTWLLADDDDYDFSDCDDLIKAIDSEKYDVLFFFSSSFDKWAGKSVYEILRSRDSSKYINGCANGTSGKELMGIMKQYYFITMTFIPACIFKTDIYTNKCFIEGYDNIKYLYPHLKFVEKTIVNDLLFYKKEKDMVIEGFEADIKLKNRNASYSMLRWMNSWLISSLIIKDKKIRSVMIDRYRYNYHFLYMIGFSMLQSKFNKDIDLKDMTIILISNIFIVKGLIKGFGYMILILMIYITPRFIYSKILNKAHKKIEDSRI
jgi:glycosyltransferase involved in cell wall biosynthesis